MGSHIKNDGVYVSGGAFKAENVAVGEGATVNVAAPAGPARPADAHGHGEPPTAGQDAVSDPGNPPDSVDFYVSYVPVDLDWARWIAWELEAAGYRVHLQDWDALPGSHRVHWLQQAMQSASRTLAVLSAGYLRSASSTAEWEMAWAHDPTGAELSLLLVRIEDCEQPGLLNHRVALDLFDQDREIARERLLNAAAGRRGKPVQAPAFPHRPAPAFPRAHRTDR